jgi:uncharacterized membrane protein YbhN (UPF0104 family)
MKKLYSALKYLLLLLLAGILLWFSFKGVKWSDFLNGIKDANYWWILASMAISIVAFFVRAVRGRMIMQTLGKPVKLRDSWDGVNIGYLTNFAAPRAGELARCGVIAKKSGIPVESVVGSVVLERSIDLLSLIILVILVVFLSWKQFGTFIHKEILGAIPGKFSTPLILVASAIILAFAIFIYIVFKYRERHPIFKKIVKITKGLFDGLVSGFKMKQKWLFILLTVILWTCYWLMSLTTIYAFPKVSFLGVADALFLMVVGSLGWLIPVQGGIGAFHFVTTLALAHVYGISQTTGLVFATISHESQALTMVICGTLSFVSFSLSRQEKEAAK